MAGSSPAPASAARPTDRDDVIARPDTLHAFFEASARRRPDAIAIDVPPGPERPARETVTYAQLNRQAEAVAGSLAPLVSHESIVAILVPRTSSQVYSAQVGVLKAGAAYTCIDVTFPDEQIRDILSDSGAVALLTDASSLARVGAFGFAAPPVIELNEVCLQPDTTPVLLRERPDVEPLSQPSWLEIGRAHV